MLGHLQRGGSQTPFDRILATRFGVAAADLALSGKYGQMVALRGLEIISVPLEEAVGNLRTVPVDGNLVRVARMAGITFGDETES